MKVFFNCQDVSGINFYEIKTMPLLVLYFYYSPVH